jgi:hypothetical protein
VSEIVLAFEDAAGWKTWLAAYHQDHPEGVWVTVPENNVLLKHSPTHLARDGGAKDVEGSHG